MLEKFCSDLDKPPPTFERILNKTNGKWSCKVKTYKTEYVAGKISLF
jgi:hypothetical protein